MSIFHGLCALPITPTDEYGVVDADGVMRITKNLSDSGVDAIGLLGTPGIYVYLTRTERRRCIRAAVTSVGGKTSLIVGIGAFRTDDAQDLARDAEAEGADGLLVTPLACATLTAEEIVQHCTAVAGATNLPISICDEGPGAGLAYDAAVLDQLAKIPNVAAMKIQAHIADHIVATRPELEAASGKKLFFGCADDKGIVETLRLGIDGWFSVLAGYLPQTAKTLFQATKTGNQQVVDEIAIQMQPLWDLALELGGLRLAYAAASELAAADFTPPLPLLPLTENDRNRVAKAIWSGCDGYC